LRRNGHLPVAADVPTAGTPLRHVPGIALTDDPPCGRILVAADQAPLVLHLQRILRDAGYRAVGPAESVEDAERLAQRLPLDGAVIDLDLGDGAVAIADRLVRNGIALVWLTARPTEGSLAPRPHRHERVPAVTKPVNGADLIEALERALSTTQRSGSDSFYPVPPPQTVWPRVFPQF
jgi:CheY-like chemotaxis protein